MGQSTFRHLRDRIQESTVRRSCPYRFRLQKLESRPEPSQARHPWNPRGSVADPVEAFPGHGFHYGSQLQEPVGREHYRFYLPDDRDMGWFCGSSGGWLLMAGGNRSSYVSDSLNPDLFLWNPLNGSTRNLPRLTTHPCYPTFRDAVAGGSMLVSLLFDRVHVFSHSSADCVVAAVLNRLVSPANQISLCTPGDGRWTTFGESVDTAIYIDVRYLESSGSLWLLAKSLKQAHVKEASRGGVCLFSGCTVPVSLCFLDRDFRAVDLVFDRFDFPQSSLTSKDERQVFRLVEDAVHEDGDVLVAATHIDRRFRVRHGFGGKEAMVRDRTRHVSFIVPFHDNRRSEELASVGNRTVFLGSTGTDSIVVSNPMRGIETDCVYLAIDDSHEHSCRYNENRKSCIVQEQCVYFLKSKKMSNDYSTEVGCCPLVKIGWFEPKIFLK